MDAMQVDGGASSGCAPLRALALELHEVGEALQEAVDEASALLGPNGRHEPLTVDNETLLAYARAVCRTTYAPHGWPNNTPANDARRHCGALYESLQPPVPTERELQASALHSQPPLPRLQQPLLSPVPKAAPSAPQVLSQAQLAALLAALPPRPANWKPGDALPLLPAIAQLQAPEELRYVPRVQLGSLNPDLEAEVVDEEAQYSDESSDS